MKYQLYMNIEPFLWALFCENFRKIVNINTSGPEFISNDPRDF